MAEISVETTKSDLLAGFTNAAIVLPQGVAFAVIAGLPPQYGLYTAMITPIIAALWGSSMVMVSGPTTAISAIMFATLVQLFPPETPEYISAALVLTVIVGAFQILAGLLRVGAVISFISHSVMVGFTAAAALLIGTSQLGNMLGLTTESSHSLFGVFFHVVSHAADIDPLAVFLSTVTFLSVAVFSRVGRKLPNYFMALVFVSILGWVLRAEDAGIAMFGAIPSIVPVVTVPHFNLALVSQLAPGAATVAFIGLLEAVSIGRSFALRREEKYDANQEIIGQGMSNFVAGFFQAYAGSGSFTRSALNVDSGARTPMSAVFSAVILLILLLLLSPLATYVPVPVMAGIIAYVAVRLVSVDEIRHILSNSPSESLILILTFVAGVATRLEVAVVVGVIASLFVFLRHSATPHLSVLGPALDEGRRTLRNVKFYGLPECPQIHIQRIEGALFFGSVDQVGAEFEANEIQAPDQKIKVCILAGGGRLDLSGADFLIRQIKTARRKGGDFHIVAIYGATLAALRSMHVLDVLGEDNLHMTKGDALAAVAGQVDQDICATCRLRVFLECGNKRKPHGVPDIQTKAIVSTKR